MNAVLQQWLLNLAIDFPVPFRYVPPLLNGNDDEAHTLNVKSLPGFTLNEGVRALVELAENGLLLFTSLSEEGGSRIVAPSAVPSIADHGVKAKLWFKLTQAGGRAWESAAEPRWHDLDDASGIPSDHSGSPAGWDWTWFSQNRDRLMAVLGWYQMFGHDEQIDLGTVTWRLAKHYRIKYWKRLPNVHVVTFRSLRVGEYMPVWKRGVAPEWFSAWRIARSAWYRRPWEMEGWPPTPES